MKKKVSDFIHSLGGSCSYSGRSKTMYINDPFDLDIESAVIEKFGYELPFKLITN